MYLKQLVLKGFKSFADRSALSFEPGISAVVGPNGSGKSNISDAVLWVLGERNAKNLRGQAMEDVIFAGTAARKPLGMAKSTWCWTIRTARFLSTSRKFPSRGVCIARVKANT